MFAKALLAVHQRICRSVLLVLARAFVGDELEFSFGGRSHRASRRKGSRGARVPALHAQIEITDMRAWPLVLLGGSAGLGEAWSKGYWETPDLTAAIRIIARATSVADGPRSLLQKVGGQSPMGSDSYVRRTNIAIAKTSVRIMTSATSFSNNSSTPQ